MAAVDDPRTLGRTRLSFANEAEIDEFVATLARFESGEMGPDEWRVYRLVRGTYGQRQAEDAQMLRVKVPQGILTAPQLDALADIGERYSRGFGHITTRQNVQFHFVRLHDVEPAMRRAAEAGLTTREACGNSVRNITGCPYSGVSPDEVFDVTPYAEAMTRFLLRHPLSSRLPRKFKIAFEGCREDHAVTAINDLGWRAVVADTPEGPRRGFRVLAGGGTALMCRSAPVLFEFLPANEIFSVAEAVIRVFHRLGDYKHKQRNRLKFLIKELGWERFVKEVHETLEQVRAEGPLPLPFDPENPPVEAAPRWTRGPAPLTTEIAARAAGSRMTGPGIHPAVSPVLNVLDREYMHWLRTNVRLQKQDDYALVTVTLPLGDLTSAQLRVVSELSVSYGDGSVRVTPEQNLLFRWVRRTSVPQLYRALAAAGLGLADADTVADVTSCPGAESCRLAVTQSRGLGRLLTDFLRARPDLVAAADGLKIKISGCPNGCGQNHIAGLGFQGSVRKVDGRPVPQYFVTLGGEVTDQGAYFGKLTAKVPARRIPEVVTRLIDLYRREHAPEESAAAFFRRVEPARARAVLSDLESLPLTAARAEDYIDLGEETEFRPEVMDGECSA